MARQLSQREIDLLRQGGFSDREIQAYANGTASGNVTARANVFLASGGKTQQATGYGGGGSGISASAFGIPINPQNSLTNLAVLGQVAKSLPIPLGNQIGNFLGGVANDVQNKGTGRPGGTVSTGKKRSTALDVLTSIFNKSPNLQTWGKLGTSVAQGAANLGKQAAGAVGRSGRVPAKQGGGGLYGGQYPELDLSGLGEYPEPVIPNITLQRRDFTDQARAQVDAAFAPLFASYAQMKTDIGNRGNENRQILSGLYKDYQNDIAADAAATQAQYAQQQATTAAQGQQLANDIGGYYQGAADDTAKQLQGLGIQAAAPELLQDTASDRGWQQSQAAQNTSAMGDYYRQQAQSQAVADTKSGQIAQNQGNVAQQDLIRQVASALAGVDQNVAQSRTTSAQQALDMAMQLSDQDFSAQQANAGLAYQNAGIQNDFNLGRYGQGMDLAKLRYGAAQDQYNAGRQYWQDTEDTRRYEQDRSDTEAWRQAQLSQAAAQAQADARANAGKNAPAPYDDFTGLQALQQQVMTQYPNGGQVFNDVGKVAAEASQLGGSNDAEAYQYFLTKGFPVVKQRNPGLTDGQIYSIMSDYWRTAKIPTGG